MLRTKFGILYFENCIIFLINVLLQYKTDLIVFITLIQFFFPQTKYFKYKIIFLNLYRLKILLSK
jgi:hypothetical protein